MSVPLQVKAGADNLFRGSFFCRGKYYLHRYNIGLLVRQNNSFKLIPGGETFAGIKALFMVVPYRDSGPEILIGSREAADNSPAVVLKRIIKKRRENVPPIPGTIFSKYCSVLFTFLTLFY